MDRVIPPPHSTTVDSAGDSSHASDGYYTPKGFLNQDLIKQAATQRESQRLEGQRDSCASNLSTSSNASVFRFPSTSPLIVISPPKDETPLKITAAPDFSTNQQVVGTHRRSLIIAIVAAGLVVLSVAMMILLVLL
ncbi:unnamed protein product [Caenorhabditis auriculariae]|uniref:Uncharacterized protein n=1 Tax=Caenorhabditis auriculariae TaxID=2777116 RepID=A0A8S1GRT8_9PELO|nr:unnamed protein product [Caenorhabditis auriculariae]